MRKLLVVLGCAVVTGWVLCQPALGQTDLSDVLKPLLAVSGWNHEDNSHVVSLGALGVPGTSDSVPFVNFDQARIDAEFQLLFVSSRSSKAVAILDALTDRRVGETPAIFAGAGIDSPHSGPDGNVVAEGRSVVQQSQVRGHKQSGHC